MTHVHRLEIVVDAPHSARVVELLAAHGVSSYTLIRGVAGAGQRGPQLGDDLAGVSNNHYLLTVCPPEKLDHITAALRPLLARIGGMCLISDARWLAH